MRSESYIRYGINFVIISRTVKLDMLIYSESRSVGFLIAQAVMLRRLDSYLHMKISVSATLHCFKSGMLFEDMFSVDFFTSILTYKYITSKKRNITLKLYFQFINRTFLMFYLVPPYYFQDNSLTVLIESLECQSFH